MKTVILVFLSLLIFNPAQASLSYLTCSNGTIDQVGDGLMVVDIHDNGIEFQPYEASFGVDATQVAYQGGTQVVTNQTVVVSVEGTEETVVLNAMLHLNDANTKLNVAYSTDYGAFRSYELECKTVVIDIN